MKSNQNGKSTLMTWFQSNFPGVELKTNAQKWNSKSAGLIYDPEYLLSEIVAYLVLDNSDVTNLTDDQYKELMSVQDFIFSLTNLPDKSEWYKRSSCITSEGYPNSINFELLKYTSPPTYLCYQTMKVGSVRLKWAKKFKSIDFCTELATCVEKDLEELNKKFGPPITSKAIGPYGALQLLINGRK